MRPTSINISEFFVSRELVISATDTVPPVEVPWISVWRFFVGWFSMIKIQLPKIRMKAIVIWMYFQTFFRNHPGSNAPRIILIAGIIKRRYFVQSGNIISLIPSEKSVYPRRIVAMMIQPNPSRTSRIVRLLGFFRTNSINLSIQKRKIGQ